MVGRGRPTLKRPERRTPAKSSWNRGGVFVRGKMAAEQQQPEWLPAGWKVEVRTRQSGSTAGLRDKYYTSPVDGCRFRSKNEVLQYLESMNPENTMSKPPMRCEVASRDLILRKESNDRLPKGWIIEVKTRSNGMHIGRQDKYYIDPSTGYKFDSLAKVWDYLETGQKRSRRSPKKGSFKKPASATRGHILSRSTARRSLFGGQKSGREFAEPSSSVCHDVDHSTEKASSKQLAVFEDNLLGNRNISSNNGLDAEKTESIPKPLESHLMQDPYSNQSLDPNWAIPIDNNLNRVEIKGPVSAGFEVEGNKSKRLAIGVQKRKRDGSSSKGKTSKPIMTPCRRSKRLAELKAELYPSFGNPEPVVVKAGDQLKSDAATSSPASQNHGTRLEHGTLPEVGVTTEMSTENMMPQASELVKDGPDCPLHPPFCNFWPDPCLEFAFKTLTDAIPVDCILPNGLILQSESPLKFQVSGGRQEGKQTPTV